MLWLLLTVDVLLWYHCIQLFKRFRHSSTMYWESDAHHTTQTHCP